MLSLYFIVFTSPNPHPWLPGLRASRCPGDASRTRTSSCHCWIPVVPHPRSCEDPIKLRGHHLIPGAEKIHEGSEAPPHPPAPGAFGTAAAAHPSPAPNSRGNSMNPLPFPGAPSLGEGAGGWQGAPRSPRSQSAVIEGSPEPPSPRLSRRASVESASH